MAIIGYPQNEEMDVIQRDASNRAAAFENLKRSGDLPALGLVFGLNLLKNSQSQGLGEALGGAGMDALATHRAIMNARRAAADREEQLAYDRAQTERDWDWKQDEREYSRWKDERDWQAAEAARRDARAARWAGIARQDAAAQKAEADKKAQEEYNKTHRQGEDKLWYKQNDDGTWELDPDKNIMGADGQILGMAKPKQDGKLVIGQSGEIGFAYPDGTFVSVNTPKAFTALPTGATPQYIPQDAAARKEVASLIEQDKAIQSMEDVFVDAPDSATGILVGNMPNSLATRYDPEGVPLRSAIANFSSQIMNALSGAAVSDQERVRLEGFLPTATDSLDTIRSKMDQYRKYLRSKADAWQETYGVSPVLSRSGIYVGKPAAERPPLDSFKM